MKKMISRRNFLKAAAGAPAAARAPPMTRPPPSK